MIRSSVGLRLCPGSPVGIGSLMRLKVRLFLVYRWAKGFHYWTNQRPFGAITHTAHHSAIRTYKLPTKPSTTKTVVLTSLNSTTMVTLPKTQPAFSFCVVRKLDTLESKNGRYTSCSFEIACDKPKRVR